MRETLSRNLAIHRQIIFVDALLAAEHIPAVLLKGAGLIEALPELMHTRFMEDIDILVRRADIAAVHHLLTRAGYWRVPEDPSAWEHDDYAESLDIIDALWYLDARENDELFGAAQPWPLPGLAAFTHLPPAEFYVHILAHTCIHHGRSAAECTEDCSAINRRWPELTTADAIRKTMAAHGMQSLERLVFNVQPPGCISRRISNSNHPLRGHILRWLFLPAKKKASFLFRTLFPSAAFIRSRYNCRTTASVIIFRIIRPVLLVVTLFSVLCKLGRR